MKIRKTEPTRNCSSYSLEPGDVFRRGDSLYMIGRDQNSDRVVIDLETGAVTDANWSQDVTHLPNATIVTGEESEQ